MMTLSVITLSDLHFTTNVLMSINICKENAFLSGFLKGISLSYFYSLSLFLIPLLCCGHLLPWQDYDAIISIPFQICLIQATTNKGLNVEIFQLKREPGEQFHVIPSNSSHYYLTIFNVCK
jgi:hypothetical protein